MKKILYVLIAYLSCSMLSFAQDAKESIVLNLYEKPMGIISFYLQTEGEVSIEGVDSVQVDEYGKYTCYLGNLGDGDAGPYLVQPLTISASKIFSLISEAVYFTTIDLRDCPSLKRLDIKSSLGELNEELDLSAQKDLVYLDCSGGALVQLNLEHNSKLEVLKCAGNQLTGLSISNLKQLKELDCSQNQLTELDLSNLDKLESVNATGNKIRSPKLGGLIHLKRLSLAENPLGKVLKIDLPELLWLKVSRCGLEKLELVNAPNLEGLECSENKLSSLDLANANTKILFLECFLNNIDGTEMGKLIASLPNWSDPKNPGNGKCYAMSYGFSPDEPDENEKNFAYEEDVKKAFDKQWAFMAKTKDGKEVKYAGRPRSTQQIANSEIVISPNPATDFVSIQGVSPNTEVRILDLSGKLLIESLARSEEVLNLDVRAIPEGNYLVVINGSSQKLAIIR
ncbi:leucine-rich repeat domain-containing protein [Porphyromonas uenonis]|uniref:leucine-rich repeat domain-containing protein n=1 Tax=Porphyromonas uenonis TaxID=281920 RepID=UPI00046EEEDE|nr:leucine-rich repeat domain-containing protein [Porphyromonas uenonis]